MMGKWGISGQALSSLLITIISYNGQNLSTRGLEQAPEVVPRLLPVLLRDQEPGGHLSPVREESTLFTSV